MLAVYSAQPGIHNGGDNAAYVALAHSLAQHGTYSEVWTPGSPPHTRYPPLYPGFLALLVLCGVKTWGILKASSLLFTGLATGYCFLWVQRLDRPSIAGLVALLFGVSPAVLFHTQWILAEPLFLALTFGCLYFLAPGASQCGKRSDGDRSPESVSRSTLAAGLGLAMAAYFTRSAGLPLVAAAAIWLGWQRRWVPLAWFAVAFAALAVPWQLRSGGEYTSAFWMINPYAPDQGVATPADLVQRVGENLADYTLDYIPAGLTGMSGSLAAAFGVVLSASVLVGWFRRVRRGLGVADIFFPLYSGLILLWPTVWSGDRFALPLYPLVLLYAGETVAWGASRVLSRIPKPTWAIAVGVAVLFLLPAGYSWARRASEASQCRPRVLTLGPMGCYGSNIGEFQAMALWARDGLPEGSAVFSRKPRIFYAFSGHPSVTYPFTDDGNSLLVQADSLGVGYVVLGNWDTTGPAYVHPVISAHPERFCVVAQLASEPGGSPISLLAVTPPSPDDAMEPAGTEVALSTCFGESTVPSAAALASMTVPILDRR